ncbi:hypothetical protein H8356DRAFT_1350269 [Neocallimastix lanati (nom. inval.)]|nr:hypothetical protein H8356DRAFT_1350269 [Neocallimastix sp. JGI-2020a]
MCFKLLRFVLGLLFLENCTPVSYTSRTLLRTSNSSSFHHHRSPQRTLNKFLRRHCYFRLDLLVFNRYYVNAESIHNVYETIFSKDLKLLNYKLNLSNGDTSFREGTCILMYLKHVFNIIDKQSNDLIKKDYRCITNDLNQWRIRISGKIYYDKCLNYSDNAWYMRECKTNNKYEDFASVECNSNHNAQFEYDNDFEAKVKYAVLFRCSFIVLRYSSQSFVNPDARYSYENSSWRLLDDQWYSDKNNEISVLNTTSKCLFAMNS